MNMRISQIITKGGYWTVFVVVWLLFVQCSNSIGIRGTEEDWYKVLGVARDATQEQIRSAYKKQVLKWHPDKNRGKEAQAQVVTAKLNNAYEVLGDAAARREYHVRCSDAQA
eukprot:CAMPEP_0113710248 /NCGR_PEP_ID=MMETSP0038_2-20120614/30044_1 /TAXON_ID=2898 /ORGANISM="Cryptomonas paramecium" /LENGTH=111 /DNA_ID=CAMNT_0000636269 /DNA_START=147 /DNA_END=479 /DNA_ORIENTATION=+ /assembly_acc=CAM_ASM_000170